MSTKKSPLKLYVAFNDANDELIGTGSRESILDSIQESIDNYGYDIDEVKENIQVYELGELIELDIKETQIKVTF